MEKAGKRFAVIPVLAMLLSPVFSGEDGVLPVELTNYDAGDTITIRFTTDDYGDTWTYSPS